MPVLSLRAKACILKTLIIPISGLFLALSLSGEDVIYSDISHPIDGKVTLSWKAEPAKHYKIESSTTLLEDSWELLNSFPITADSEEMAVSADCGCGGSAASASESSSSIFYRIKKVEDLDAAFSSLPGITLSQYVDADEGGSLSLTNANGDNISLVIPPDALPFSTQITIRAFDQAPDVSFAQKTFPGVWIDPDGLVLNSPAFLSVVLANPPSSSEGSLLIHTDSQNLADPLGREAEDGILYATLEHFSCYVGIWTSEEEAQAAADAVVGQTPADPCSDTTRIGALVDWANSFSVMGNEGLADYYMDAAMQAALTDLQSVIESPIPDPMGRLCSPNPTESYIKCLIKLAGMAELFGAQSSDSAMDRAREAVELWSGQLGQFPPPEEAAGRCKWYLPCVVRMLQIRSVMGCPESSIDETLWAHFEEGIQMGCDNCSVKWMAKGTFSASWTNYAGVVTLGGKAQWSRFNFILDEDALEEECVSTNEGEDMTFPSWSYYEELDADAKWLTDADPEFATTIVDARLVVFWGGDNSDELELNCVMHFDGESVGIDIPIESYRAAIAARRPFVVKQELSNPDYPGYSGKVDLVFTPILKKTPPASED